MNLSCQSINCVQQTSSYTIPASLLTNIGINLKQIRLESILLYTKEQEQRKKVSCYLYTFSQDVGYHSVMSSIYFL